MKRLREEYEVLIQDFETQRQSKFELEGNYQTVLVALAETTTARDELLAKVEEQQGVIDELERRRESAKREIKLLHSKLAGKTPVHQEEAK